MSTASSLNGLRARRLNALLEAPDSAPWLRDLRRRSMDRFLELGFPTTRDEDWKYTSVRAIAEGEFSEPDPVDAAPEASRLADDALRAVLLDGKLDRDRPGLEELPPGVTLTSLQHAEPEVRELVSRHLGQLASGEHAAFAALNTALFEDVVVLHVAEGRSLERPLEVVLTGTGARAERHARLLVVLEASSRATLVESHCHEGEDSFTNVVAEVFLAPDAVLEHVRLQLDGALADHVDRVAVRQARDSRYRSRVVSLGARLARQELAVTLADPGAECELDGLYLGDARQHVDEHVFVHHAAGHCSSRQLYKSVLAGSAHGVFTGRVLVDPDAQGTSAHQTNRNLVLSRSALADTRPQLEIHANDVSCTHGATIGRLDEEALFYLRSRGLGATEARGMLARAFAGEVTDRLPEAVRGRVAELVAEKLDALVSGGDDVGDGVSA